MTQEMYTAPNTTKLCSDKVVSVASAYKNLMDRLAVHEIDAENSGERSAEARGLVRPDVSLEHWQYLKRFVVMLCVCLAGPADIIHVLWETLED